MKQLAIEALRVPRYTSYPTAPHFHEGVGSSEYGAWLRETAGSQPLSLYLHIPFCRQLCWFCGCHTRVVNHYDPVRRYLELLEAEISLVGAAMQTSSVNHIHFGGGSPTILTAKDFSHIMLRLGECFQVASGADIAVEIDPRTVDEEKIAAYAACGVNRASIGVQDFDSEVQQAVNRLQPYEDVLEKIRILRKTGIDALNIDLIYGLPYQTLDTIRMTVERTVSLVPSRISLFGYAHVPWMKKHQQLIPQDGLPDTKTRQAMFECAAVMLEEAGYVAVGLDHFALPDDPLVIAMKEGRLQRNFQGYTTDDAGALVGFGVSAISSLPQGYAQNTSDIKAYAQSVKGGNLPIIRGYALTDEDRRRRALIMTLMCQMQVEVDFSEFPGEREAMEPFIAEGIVEISGSMLRVLPAYRHLLRIVASRFDAHMQESAQRYSQAV